MSRIHYNFLRFPGGLSKAVTFSYDDGAPSDIRLVETFDKYSLKCTLNLTGSAIASGKGIGLDFIQNTVLAHGHEIATHGYMHRAPDAIRPIEGIRETLDCRLALEAALGRIIRGMAYPDRHVNKFTQPMTYDRVKTYLSDLDIAYARMAGGNKSFELPEDWLNWMPTAHHAEPESIRLIDEFLALDVSKLYISQRSPKLFFTWGHSFEFEGNKNWDLLDAICARISGKADIWYATCMEICTYARAYESLIWSADGRTVYNPTLIDIWFDEDGTVYKIASGETLKL